MTARELVVELAGKRCRCGRKKGRGKTFCYRDFMALPRKMRDALYNRVGEGYEEAYVAAELFLAARGVERA